MSDPIFPDQYPQHSYNLLNRAAAEMIYGTKAKSMPQGAKLVEIKSNNGLWLDLCYWNGKAWRYVATIGAKAFGR